MLNNPQQRKALVLSLLMVTLAQTAYIGAMQGWSYPTELDEVSPQSRSGGLENLFPDLDLRLFVDPSNSSSYSGSGTNLVDLSTYYHNGTIDGATWAANRTRFTYDGTCTGTSPSFVCDEVNFTETNDHDPDTGGDWSVSTWFNASSLDAQHNVIVGKFDDGGTISDVGWAIRIKNDGVRVDVGTTGNSSAAWTPRQAVATDRWYHLVMVADQGTSLAMFIDGAEVKNISLASSGNLRNTGNGVSIGSYNAGEYNQPFDGQIGAVMAYADALNLTAVNQLYNASKGVYSNTTNLSYATSSSTLTLGQAYSFPLTVANGTITTSYSLSGTLPSGMNFGASNGTIWGTPTAVKSNTTYTVTANNSAGTYSTSLSLRTISSIDLIPSAASSNLTIGQAMADITFQTNGTHSIANPAWTAADIDTSADGAHSVVAADMDGDGDLDIVSASFQDDTIAWYENDGTDNPSWTAANIATTADGAVDVYVADMDGDGDLDIVSASESDDTIAWYENDGAANPSWTAADIATSADGARSVYVADMDGDGDLDIVSASRWDNTIAWYENDGAANPSWTAADIATSAADARSVYVADMDGDGDLDIVSASYNDDTIAWYENDGAANPSWTAADISTSADGAASVYVADMDGDGDLDIVSASIEDDTIAWYENDGAANPSWTAANIATTADAAYSVYVADMDGDGDLDIVSASSSDDTIAWYENDGAANPSWTAADISTSADSAASVYVADMDGDGDLDIISASYNDDTIAWYEQTETRTWVTSFTIANPSWTAADIATSADGAYSVVVADMDGDGDLDIVSASGVDDTIAWYENDGAANPTWAAADIATNASNARSVFVADMDGDGDLDIVSASADDDTIAWYENDGAANPSWTAADIDTNADGALSVYVADMDNDGDLDIVSASYLDDTIAWYENDGAANPSWTATDIATTADGAASVFVADMDGDGDLDIVSASDFDDTIAWYENDGAANPSWTAADISTTADGAYSVYVADMDGDGDLDIVSASYQDDTVAWYENDGASNPSWTASDIFTTADGSGSVYVADMDGDGDLDIISASAYDDTVRWLENDGAANPSWTASTIATSADLVFSVFVADMDDDGDLDIVSGSYLDDTVAWYEQTGTRTWEYTNVTGANACTISPSLPSGMSINSSTCTISGTPTAMSSSTTYTVTANFSTWQGVGNFTLAVNAAPPNSLGYSPENMTLTKGTAMTTNTPSVSGGAVTSWEISPSLPTGLSFSTSTGAISGTPTVLQTTATTYTIWANNSGGSASANINITINDVVPNALGYSPENMTLEKGTAMTTNTPSVSGGTVTSWEISPSLPTGLSFSTSTGAISGTPTVLQTTATTYTIWANNSGGSASANINITINDQVASISYSSPVEIFNNRALSSTITPSVSGGAVTSWEITPSLPTGLTFGTTNGSIWGTPENVTSNATYTIYANNSGGSASTTLTLNINWTLTPSAGGAYITRNASIGSDLTWEWDYEPLEAQNLSLVTGEWNTCALDSNQNVFCWGRNGNGQIGNGQTSTVACDTSGHRCKDIPTATNDLGSDVVSLAFGHQHACGLLDTGAVKCWGRNNNGQLGTSGGDKDTPQSINLGSGRTATSIYAGGYYTCAILDDESVKCWGENGDGQLGIGSWSNTNTPTTINTLGSGRTAVSLATAYNAVCALLDDGSVKCWGDDNFGQLGNGGSNVDLSSPPSSAINLGSGRTAKAITGGEYHFCAILDDDSIKCWGDGTDGKLGTGSTAAKNTPAATSGSFASGRYAVLIDAGYDHTCVILDNGDLTCWGSDAKGQLGNGATTGTKSSLQTSVVSLGTGRTAISLSAGGTHTCAQLDNGQLKCWGNRADGQVGDNGGFNSPSDRTSPSTVSNNNHGGNTYQNTGQMPSAAVSGATCGISPALPTGMSLTSGTCAITGTPTVTAINATYTVWANISGTSFSGQVWLEVGLNAPILSYSPTSYLFVDGVTITEVTPTNTGGEISGFEISPALPAGLAIGSTNGTIWGTPTAASSQTTYTIWGNNSAGSSSTTITIKVETSPTSLAYDTENMTLTKSLAMTANTATVGGGTPTSWEISPSLPSGLSFSSTTGEISGTPTVLQTTAVTYTVWANNTAGSVNTSLNITINDVAPNSVVYSPENMTLNNNTAMTTNTPTAGGGTVTSWEISPALPSGLSFGSTNGSIWGTPTVEQASTTYTVWANNSGGSSTGSINITIDPEPVPTLSYSPNALNLINNTVSSDLPLAPTLTGPGTIATWAINASLPSGLSFSTTNGSIYGTPTELWNTTAYMVWANNSGGSSVAYLNITVVDELPTLSYSPENLTLTKNQTSTDLPLNATLTGSGAITSWAISPALPSGLSFGTSNGTIWGIPTVLQTTATTYTIWANNSGGSTSATVNITINDQAPGPFEYNPENNTLTNNTYVHLEPDFINITTGNGSSWSTPAGIFHPFADSDGRPCLSHIHNGTLYAAATNGTGTTTYLYGFGLSNSTAWLVNSTVESLGCVHYVPWYFSSYEKTLAMSYGTSLYFEAKEGTWEGLFGYGLENGTLWRESSDELEITSEFTAHFDDVFYFGAYINSSVGNVLHAHNLSNGTTWLVLDASNGSTIRTGGFYDYKGRANAVGDVFFFTTYINSKDRYWGYNTSNGSAWEISSDENAGPGHVLDGVFYYASGDDGSSWSNPYLRLHAYNASNETSWRVHTRWDVKSISEFGGVLYYSADSTTSTGNSDNSLWAHNPTNGTTWEISDSVGDVRRDFVYAGGTLFYQLYTGNNYAYELWAYQPSNATAWQIADAGLNGGLFTSLGNTVYFTSHTNPPSSSVHELWAYNTANETTWFVTNISATNWGWTSSGGIGHPEVTSLIFAGNTLYIREGGGMRLHQPASINYQTNTGGAVTSWAINASLPSGLSFSTTNGSKIGRAHV